MQALCAEAEKEIKRLMELEAQQRAAEAKIKANRNQLLDGFMKVLRERILEAIINQHMKRGNVDVAFTDFFDEQGALINDRSLVEELAERVKKEYGEESIPTYSRSGLMMLYIPAPKVEPFL